MKIWATVFVMALGVAIGVRFRAPMLLAAAAITVSLCALAGALQNWALSDIVSMSLILLVVLQLSYVAALFARQFWTSRRKKT